MKEIWIIKILKSHCIFYSTILHNIDLSSYYHSWVRYILSFLTYSIIIYNSWILFEFYVKLVLCSKTKHEGVALLTSYYRNNIRHASFFVIAIYPNQFFFALISHLLLIFLLIGNRRKNTGMPLRLSMKRTEKKQN